MDRLPGLLVLTAVMGLTLAAPAAAQNKENPHQMTLVAELSTIEKSLWDGYANHDPAPFREHLVENHAEIGPYGVNTGKQGLIEYIESHDCELEDYSFSDWDVHHVSEDVVMLTYTANQDGTCEGEEMPSKVVGSSTYVRDGGKWMNAAYHETPASDGQ